MTVASTFISRATVESMAPDAASLRAAQQLASGTRLCALCREGALAWGEVSGSGVGASPYRVACALEEPAGWKCSCPSRKLPCKHAMALALRFLDKSGDFEAIEAPSWVLDWSKARARQKSSGDEKPVDVAAQAKRVAAREEKVANGLADLEVWLRDIVRGGIASLPAQPYGFWDKASARMVDAQARGLARRLRELASLPHRARASGSGEWHEEMARQLGLVHLIIEGYKRLDSLSPERAADIRALIGWEVNQKDLLANGAPVRDRWLCLAYTEDESEDGLRVGRTWLWGETSARAALILRFERVGWSASEAALVALPGTAFEGELVFFPGSLGQRALVKENIAPCAGFVPRGLDTSQVLEAWAQGLARFPWLDSLPCVLRDVVLTAQEDRLWAVDGAGALPICTRHADKWALLACGGGRALSVFGLWDGRALEPLATAQEDDGRVHIATVARAAS